MSNKLHNLTYNTPFLSVISIDGNTGTERQELCLLNVLVKCKEHANNKFAFLKKLEQNMEYYHHNLTTYDGWIPAQSWFLIIDKIEHNCVGDTETNYKTNYNRLTYMHECKWEGYG